jgi:hypothetical protein
VAEEGANPAERRALSALCDELPILRELCAAESANKQQTLARIEAEARARRPVAALLRDLLGADANDPTRGLGVGLPGAGPGQADEESFGCPDRACDRVSDAVPAGPVPYCVITGLPMSRR